MEFHELEQEIIEYVKVREQKEEEQRKQRRELAILYNDLNEFLKEFHNLNKKYKLDISSFKFDLYYTNENKTVKIYTFLTEINNRCYLGIDETPLYNALGSTISKIDLETTKKEAMNSFLKIIKDKRG